MKLLISLIVAITAQDVAKDRFIAWSQFIEFLNFEQFI